MIKTRDEIAEIYQKAYPEIPIYENIDYFLIFSEEIWVPTFDEMWQEILKYSSADMPFIQNVADCNVRSWGTHARIQKERGMMAGSLPKDEQRTWPIGWLAGIRKSAFGDTSHVLMTTFSRDLGIRNIDQDLNVKKNLIFEVDRSKFDALLLVM